MHYLPGMYNVACTGIYGRPHILHNGANLHYCQSSYQCGCPFNDLSQCLSRIG